MTSKHCPACRAEMSADLERCPVCAALMPATPASTPLMPDESARSSAASPNLSKIGLGAMGNVDVKYDNSQHTTNNVSHHSSSTSQAHHEDKSQHTDQSVTKQTTVNNSGLPPIVLFSTLCVVIAGFVLFRLTDRPQEYKSASGSPPPPSIVLGGSDHLPTMTSPAAIENKPSVIDVGAPTIVAPSQLPAADAGGAKPVATGVIPSLAATATAPPIIEAAEIGIVSQGRFIPTTEFKTNDLLTLRLRVSRDCRLRAIYQQASGPPLRMFPETDGGSDLIRGGSEVFIPDPSKLAAHAADATAFKLFHDTGSGPPIREQIIVQIAEEPFTQDGTTRSTDIPYRVFEGLTLADARMRGVVKLQGLSVSQAQAKMDALLSERTLSFTISP